MATDWLDTKEAAAYLGVAESTLAGRRRRGTGPEYQKGPDTGRIYYRRDILDAWRPVAVVHESGSTWVTRPERAPEELLVGVYGPEATMGDILADVAAYREERYK